MEKSRTIAGIAIGLLACLAIWAGVTWLSPEQPLPELFPMPEFELTSEQGKAVRAEDLRGQVVVANFIFTRCPTVCPGLTARMARLQSEIPADLPVRLVSFSVDPRHDTPEVLREYGEKYGQDPRRWTFLTGDFEAVLKAVEEGFRIGVKGVEDPNASPFDIVHGEHFVLIDRKGRIRGYYPNAEPDLRQLVRDAKRLAREG
ncbi:MAG: SCO family protein [Pseudomonadota bacterium]